MPAIEAIQSATITNAMLLKMSDEIGQIQKRILCRYYSCR